MSLADLKRLHEAATPGPWVHCPKRSWDVGGIYALAEDWLCPSKGCHLGHDKPVSATEQEYHTGSGADAALIIALRNKLPTLLACIEAADAWHDCDCSTCTYESSGCKLGLDIAYYQARAELEESK